MLSVHNDRHHRPAGIVKSTYTQLRRFISEPKWVLFEPQFEAIQRLRVARRTNARTLFRRHGQ
jgi:hypothetical protein